ncbi:hypothetical protein ES703_125706 [subsurface metagenome]
MPAVSIGSLIGNHEFTSAPAQIAPSSTAFSKSPGNNLLNASKPAASAGSWLPIATLYQDASTGQRPPLLPNPHSTILSGRPCFTIHSSVVSAGIRRQVSIRNLVPKQKSGNCMILSMSHFSMFMSEPQVIRYLFRDRRDQHVHIAIIQIRLITVSLDSQAFVRIMTVLPDVTEKSQFIWANIQIHVRPNSSNTF